MRKNYGLIIIDMQNDDCHTNGIYNKNSLSSTNTKKIIPNIIEAILFCRKMQIPIIATQLTILEDLQQNAITFSASLLNHRSFLKKEGFRLNTWGHALLEELPEVDYKVKKWGMSAFHQTELEKITSSLKLEELLLCGFTTNGSVETLAREAIDRNYKTIVFTDCVAAYSDTLNQTSLANLSTFGKIISSKDWFEQFESST